MPDIHDYLRRTYGPLPEAKAEKVKPAITFKLECNYEAIAETVNEMLASFEEVAREAIEEEVRRRLDREGGL